MKFFISKNWFKITTLLIVVLMFGFVICLYKENLTIRIKAQKILEQEKESVLVENCVTDGDKYFKEYQTQNNDRNIIWDDPEFHFSHKLNSCLVWFRYVDQSSENYTIQHNQITDLNSNKVILLSDVAISSNVEKIIPSLVETQSISRNEFLKQKYIIMNE